MDRFRSLALAIELLAAQLEERGSDQVVAYRQLLQYVAGFANPGVGALLRAQRAGLDDDSLDNQPSLQNVIEHDRDSPEGVAVRA